MTVNGSNHPLTAICTPVYNGEKYLAETMECVQAQTYPNLIHVIVDNASTDATPAIIDRYRAGRVPLHVTRNPSTISANDNLNRVISTIPADTRYLRVLCADDIILPQATERMVAIMERDPGVGLVAAAEVDKGWREWPPGEIFDGRATVAAYFRDELPTSFAHCVFRREFFDRRAPAYFEDFNTNDVDFALAVMCEAKIGYVQEPQVSTRVHEATITSREMGDARMHYAEWLIMLERYGPRSLGAEETKALARRFKRHYLRRMLRWRFVDRNLDLVRRHLKLLDVDHIRPGFTEYVDAVIDWPLKAVGLRPRWNLYPF